MAAAREEKRRAVVRRRGAAGREKRLFEGILKGERVLDVRRKAR
jgi:hypothetical protein